MNRSLPAPARTIVTDRSTPLACAGHSVSANRQVVEYFEMFPPTMAALGTMIVFPSSASKVVAKTRISETTPLMPRRFAAGEA